MRVFSGKYYQNLFYVLDALRVPHIERKFLFAFADEVKYYFLHFSNNHRLPRLCRQQTGVVGSIKAVFTFVSVLLCYFWLTICCFFIPARVEGVRGATETETMGSYLKRMWLPQFFIEDYLVPLFSSVASSPHKLFLDFPAFYLTDYKCQTHMFPHKTSVSMALMQERLIQGINVVYSARITKLQPLAGGAEGVDVTYADLANGGKEVKTHFDRVILAVNPKQAALIHPPSSYVMSKLRVSDVRVVIHTDYSCLPEDSEKFVEDGTSELIAMQICQDPMGGGKTTVATHAHPSGVLVTVWPGELDLIHIDESKILHDSHFVRLLSAPASRQALASLFKVQQNAVSDAKMRGKSGQREPLLKKGQNGELKRKDGQWQNGDEGIFICGGWAWDGFALLEGCVWSGLSTARSVGAELPFEPVERRWR
jgi:hypothetical protein